MDVKEFLDQKAQSKTWGEYNDFNHWLDCSTFEQQGGLIEKWMNEYHLQKSKEEAQERYELATAHLLDYYFGARYILLTPEKEALQLAAGIERKEER
jgi:hypothetical protein